MKEMRLKLLTLIFSLFCSNAWAQMGKLFNADNQLSSNFANYVYQDRDGFIWVSTRNGLNRYDGYQFRIFRKEDEDCGLNSNYINSITQSHDGTIFVGSHNSIQAYDGSRFNDVELKDVDGKTIHAFINYLVETKAGDLLACTSGYGILRLNAKERTGKADPALSGNQNYVRYLLEDRTGRYWILTEDHGLFLVKGKQRTSYFTDEESRSSLSMVMQDSKNNIYVPVRDMGVFRYDEKQRQFVLIPKTAGLSITAFYIDTDDQLLIGCDGQGLFKYNPKDDTLINNPYYTRDMDIKKGKVSSILEDRNGNIWVCLLHKGLFMQPKARLAFGYMGERLGDKNVIGSNCVTSTLIDKRGRFWIGTDKDGLYMMDKNSLGVRHFTNCPSTILCMAEDVRGRIWIGSYTEGCGWIDPVSGAWHRELANLGKNISVFGLAPASNGDMWLATMGNGLMRYNVESGALTTYQMKEGADRDRKMNSIPNNFISKICLSADEKKLFVASSIGLSCYDIPSDNWVNTFGTNCPNYNTFTRSIHVDKKGRVWVATNEGLYYYDLKTHKDGTYTTQDGLPSNGVASVMSDKHGNLWLGTDFGLCNFSPEKQTCINYYVDDGLQGTEFSDGAISLDVNSGTLLLGGTGGISWFDPSEVKPKAWKSKLQITGFTFGHTPVAAGTKSGVYTVTDKEVINSDRFDLCCTDNSFNIQLSTFTYENPEHITYLYSINGEEWKKLKTGHNEITLTHLNPGTYRFKVKAMNNQQETDVREFVVKVHSPWYASGWAFLFYLLLVALGIYAFLRNLRKKEQDRMRLQEHIHAEELADAKLRFFMNISHEIRTPMTLIVAPLLQLMKQDDDPQRRGLYETIRRNAERILGLINQMMDFRKIDKGQMQMRMCETDLIGFVGDIHTLFAQQAKMKNMKFDYEHDTDRLPIWIDKSNFDKVVVNILSNAFKFTPPGGTVRIRVTHDDTHARIAVYDNGESIPEDKIHRIFERFYQLPMSGSQMGTGIGLDLTRSLVELHHGTIEVHNNDDGKGCEFVVTIPLGNAHLQPEEMITETQEPIQVVSAMEEELNKSFVKDTSLKMNRKQRLVIVEDDDEIRKYLMDELGTDYTVVGCENGLIGLKEVLREMPDLVISDIMMPEMDGNMLCSKIRSNPSVSHVPVILLTAKNLDEDQLEGLETGADAYIVKPFNMDILKRTIINLINKHYSLRMKYGRNDQLEEKVETVQMKSPDDRLLERVMAVINKNLGNSDLSVDRIADEVGISRVHLHRKMKELTGQTPHDFIRNIRLKQAAHLLANQNMNVTEVMYACGFNNAASFSTIFKKFYGLSPRDFMKEHTRE